MCVSLTDYLTVGRCSLYTTRALHVQGVFLPLIWDGGIGELPLVDSRSQSS